MTSNNLREFFCSAFFCVSILIVFSACVRNTQKMLPDEMPNLPRNQQNAVSIQKSDEISAESQENTVSLKPISISPDKAVLELSNETDKTIYLFYFPTKNNNVTSEVFHYWFRCKEERGKEIDYNSSGEHSIPSLEPLKKGESFRFEVAPLPKINATCKVSLLYYNDEKIVNLINNKVPNLDKSEFESAEKAKKSATLQFQLNSE